MQHITDIVLLNHLKSIDALFILFEGENCSVCQSLKPQLTPILKQHFPDMQSIYVDCERSPDICAQLSVFTLPVVMAYIDGMKVAEEARVFSITQLIDTIERPYTMWKNSTPE